MNIYHTVYWEIFAAQIFQGLVILKVFANKFSRMGEWSCACILILGLSLHARKIHKSSEPLMFPNIATLRAAHACSSLNDYLAMLISITINVSYMQ